MVVGVFACFAILFALLVSLRSPWPEIKQSVRQVQWQKGAAGGYRIVDGTDQTFGFDGSGNRVLAADAEPFHFGTNQDFSVEAWIKAYPLPSKAARQLLTWTQTHPALAKFTPAWLMSWMNAHSIENDYGVTPVVDKHQTPSPFESIGFQLYLDSGRLACQLSQAPMRQLAFQNFVSPGPNLQDGRWHHVALSVVRALTNGGNLYVDGRPVLSFDPTSQSGDLSNSQPLRIGNHANPNLRCRFKGAIGNVVVYGRALKPEEIAASAQGSPPRW